MWSALEVAPGKWDWADYDRMMDLAHQNGIKVIIASLDNTAPEWAFRKFPQARYKASDDSIAYSSVSASSGVGGFPGLCLDNPEVKALAENFHIKLIEHYRNHPALLGYDLWNETTYNGGRPGKANCFCDASKQEAAGVAQDQIRFTRRSLQDMASPQLRRVGRHRAPARLQRLSGKPRLAPASRRQGLQPLRLAHPTLPPPRPQTPRHMPRRSRNARRLSFCHQQ